MHASVASHDVPARLQELLGLHGRWLRTVLAVRSGDPAAADELFQEVAVGAMRGWAVVGPAGPSPPWLYTIAVRVALLHRRKYGRQRRKMEGFQASGLVPEEGRAPDPLTFLLAKERQQLVRDAMLSLSPKDRELLLLKYTECWSYDEISRHLGLTAGQVTTRLHRARGKLRTLLEARQIHEVTA